MNRTAHLRTMCILPVLALMPLAAFGQQATVGAAATLKSHEARYQQMMQRFGDEPNIRTVQEDAIRYATAEPERVQSWFTRTAWANVLPERLQGRVDVDNRDNRNASTKDGV